MTILMTIRTLHYGLVLLSTLGVTSMLGPRSASAQQHPHPPAQALGDGMELHQVRSNFYVLTGAGGNIGIQVGPDGAVLVDAGDAAHADRVTAEIRKISPQPVSYIINTSADADHVGGNAKVSQAGKTLFRLVNAVDGSHPTDLSASILAAEGVLFRMSASTAGVPAFPAAGWPGETFGQSRKYIYLNGEGIEIVQQPDAHADGDSIVFFRRSDVVMAGDVIDVRRFPFIDVKNGGTINGVIAALNRLVDLAIPSVPLTSREAGTVVVPGHGRIMDQIDVADYRDMVTVVRDRIAHLKSQGRSLAEVKASNPTQGYTRRYGSDKGPWTTDMFIEAVYATLPADSN